MHGRSHETVHKQSAGVFVDFVLDGVSVHRDFDDDVEGFRNFATGGDLVQGHGVL